MAKAPSKIRQLAGTTAIYSLGSLLAQFVSFLLLPLYTRLLTTADYGALSVLMVVSSTIALLTELSLVSGVFRFYHAYETEQDRRRLLATAATGLLVVGGALSLVLQLTAPLIAPVLLDFPDAVPLVRIVAVIGALGPLNRLYLTLFQLDQKPVKFASLTLLQFLVSVVATVTMVAGLRWGVWGVLLGHLSGALAMSTLSLPKILRVLPAGIDREMGRKLVSFSLPLIPANISGLIIALADRFFLEELAGLGETGLYSVADKMAMVLQVLLVVPFSRAFVQLSFQAQRSTELPAMMSRVFRNYVGLGCIAVVGLSFSMREVMGIATAAEFATAYPLVPLLATAPFMHGLVQFFATGVHLANKTAWTPLLFSVATGANLALNALWIPTWGMWGAAAATAISTALNATGYYFASSRFYPVRYAAGAALVVITAAASVCAVYIFYEPASWWMSLLMRAGLLSALVAVVVATGTIRATEIQAALRALRSRLARAPKPVAATAGEATTAESGETP